GFWVLVWIYGSCWSCGGVCLYIRAPARIAILFQSHRQHNLSSRLSPLKRTVRIGGICQGKSRTDAEVEPAVFDAVEEHRRTLRQLFRRADEPRQRRAGQEDPARGIQALDIERRHLT